MDAQQSLNFENIVSAAKAQQRRTQQIHTGATSLLLPCLGVMGELSRSMIFQQGANQLIKGFRCTPILFFAVGRQLQVHDRHAQSHAVG